MFFFMHSYTDVNNSQKGCSLYEVGMIFFKYPAKRGLMVQMVSPPGFSCNAFVPWTFCEKVVM